MAITPAFRCRDRHLQWAASTLRDQPGLGAAGRGAAGRDIAGLTGGQVLRASLPPARRNPDRQLGVDPPGQHGGRDGPVEPGRHRCLPDHQRRACGRRHPDPEGTGRGRHHRAARRRPGHRSGREMPPDDQLMTAPPGHQVLHGEPGTGQDQRRWCAAGRAAAGSRRARPRRWSARAVGGWRACPDPGPPAGPEGAPHLGRVGAVDLGGVVRGGGPLVASRLGPARRSRSRCRPAAAPRRMDHAAERVGVRVRGQLIRARRADIGEQVPAARPCGPDQPGAGQRPAAPRSAGPGRSAATRRRGTGYPSLSSGTVAGRGQHRAQPAAHRAIASLSSGCGALAGGREQPGHVDEVGEDLAVVGGRPLVVPAVGQDLDRQLAGQPLKRPGEQCARRRGTPPARPAP